MAENNYYGFTAGGTQYGNQFTPAVSQYTTQQYANTTGSTQIAVNVPATAGYSNQSYAIGGYTRPTNTSQGQGQVGQSYYSQQPYQNQSQVAATPRAAVTAARTPTTSTVYPSYAANTSSASYAGFTPAAQSSTSTNSTGASTGVSNYDMAVYNAVAQYAQGGSGSSTSNRGQQGLGFKRGGAGGMGKKWQGSSARPPPKPQTIHYCDVCKISCAGPQTYKEHLEGQKHKKKEVAMKQGIVQAMPKGSPVGLRCELCDVTCTGSDAYSAHIRGSKHQKVYKLHTKLGKPIPSDNPKVVQAPAGQIGPQHPPPKSNKSHGNNSNNFSKQQTPKINFLGPKTDYDRYGSNPHALGSDSTSYPLPTAPASSQPPQPSWTGGNAVGLTKVLPDGQTFVEKDIQAVGQDYIEEIRTDDGKGFTFNCKLCDCKFNDPNAKEMHMKGRRHRLQYKKKVNPDLVVDVKPSNRNRKIEDRRAVGARPVILPPRRLARPPMIDFPRPVMAPLLPPPRPMPPPFGFHPPGYGQPTPFFAPQPMRRPESLEDRHVMAKHAEIYPKEEELQAIQKVVSNSEKALKFVSDEIAEEDSKLLNGAEEVKAEDKEQEDKTTVDSSTTVKKTTEKPEVDLHVHRILKGVMRVGALAKGLLLRGDRTVELVVLCSAKPTHTLLKRVSDALPKHLKVVVRDEEYEVKLESDESRLTVTSGTEPKITIYVTLTSPVMRSQAPAADGEVTATTLKEPEDLLDKDKCLAALAALRHAKWFQARAASLQSCVIVIRILRDLTQRIPAWNALNPWAAELIAEKAINSAGMPISPGEALRLVFELIASGVILTSGPGILDPCEKEPSDALACLSLQTRDEVTAYAQQALRQIQFQQIHKVLGIEEIPRFGKKNAASRKRRRNASAGGETDGSPEVTSDGKKDKKEGDEPSDELMEPEVKTTTVTVP